QKKKQQEEHMKIAGKLALTHGVAISLIMGLGGAQAQTVDKNPAVRTHVKIVDGQAIKFTSKLKKVVELNFTFGFHHSGSKTIISETLTRVADMYGDDGVPAFTVQKHVGPNAG